MGIIVSQPGQFAISGNKNSFIHMLFHRVSAPSLVVFITIPNLLKSFGFSGFLFLRWPQTADYSNSGYLNKQRTSKASTSTLWLSAMQQLCYLRAIGIYGMAVFFIIVTAITGNMK